MVAYRVDFRIDDLIDNKYRIVKRIGTGSYGDVYKVEDIHKNTYALKLLRLWEVSSDLHQMLLKKFDQEYKTAKINNEYLVHSIDFGVYCGNPYFLMEFCSKGDLSKCIGQSLRQINNYSLNILQGLRALHTEGKVHRDLKPENVLIRDNGVAALTDFGVVGEMDQSKRLSEVGWWRKRPKNVQGTPLYMAPEMVDRVGGGVTYLPTVDIWSFGVMMYEILSGGSFPFGDISKPEELPEYRRIAKSGKWNKEKLKKSCMCSDWIPIIDRCLEPDYRQRYQSASEILLDMKPILGDIEKVISNEVSQRSVILHSIIVTQGDNVGNVYVINDYIPKNGKMLRVGRKEDNNIWLPIDRPDTYVSRYHFTLQKSFNDDSWIIRDGQWSIQEKQWISSTNGTYLNATKVSEIGQKIFTGDIITAGEYKFKIQ